MVFILLIFEGVGFFVLMIFEWLVLMVEVIVGFFFGFGWYVCFGVLFVVFFMICVFYVYYVYDWGSELVFVLLFVVLLMSL